MMTKKYSIAEARQDFAAIVKELENQPVIEITRRGQPVAVLVSKTEYERLQAPGLGFREAYAHFRTSASLEENGLDETFLANLRPVTPGREVDW